MSVAKHTPGPLGSRQIAALRMMNPEWVSSMPGKPAAEDLRVLESLEARGLVCRNFNRWTITDAGRAALAAEEADQPSGGRHSPSSQGAGARQPERRQARGPKPTWRFIDSRLQSLRKKGVLAYDRATGWADEDG